MIVVAVLGALASPIAATSAHASVPSRPGPPVRLTVDGFPATTAIDPDAATFGWNVADARRGASQSAFRIRVSEQTTSASRSTTKDVWDSGTVRSAQQAFVAYRGPRLRPDTQYLWTVSTRDAAGAWSPFASPHRFGTGLRDADWSAQWVRPGPPTPAPDQYTYVRKEAKVGSSPVVRAVAYVSAAHQYQLWVNGTRADAGQSFAYPDEQYYQATDITRLLHQGTTNAVGVLHHWNGAGQGRPASEPGLTAQISIVHADGTRETWKTDGTWLEHPAEWQPGPPRNEEGDFVEQMDGREAPKDWSRPGFDAHGWSPVAVLGPAGTAPFTHLFAERTRISVRPARPVSIRTLPSGAVVADFGSVVAATPSVELRRGVAGRRLAMHAGFLLDPDGQVSTTHGTQATNMGYAYTERPGSQVFRPFSYLAFRYLQVDAPGEPLDRSHVLAYVRHAAMPAGTAAQFRSSDATLNAVWNLTAHSALFSSQEQFLDTPTREKGQFLGDAFNEGLATMDAFGDQAMNWQALRDFARSQARYWPDGRINAVYPNGDGARDIPDNTELYPEWVWQYYLATGDRATLAALFPVVSRIADYVAAAVDGSTGLVTRLPGGGSDYLYGIVDWPPAMRYGYDVATVARTTVNALAVNVFDRTAQMAGALGRTNEAQAAAGRKDALTAAINGHLVRPDGIYIDGLEANGSPSSHASQQANAFALAFGVTPADRRPAVGAYVAGLGIASGPDNGLWLLLGLHAGGQDAGMMRALTDRSHPGWARIVDTGGTFTWESWTPDEGEGDSLSHGWGSSAIVAYQQALLGVRLLTPSGGGPALEVTAPGAGPAAVSGTVPTVAGPVGVRWDRSGSRLQLLLTVPPNASARVLLPGRDVHAVSQRGRPLRTGAGIRSVRAERGTVTVELGAGRYRFASPAA